MVWVADEGAVALVDPVPEPDVVLAAARFWVGWAPVPVEEVPEFVVDWVPVELAPVPAVVPEEVVVLPGVVLFVVGALVAEVPLLGEEVPPDDVEPLVLEPVPLGEVAVEGEVALVDVGALDPLEVPADGEPPVVVVPPVGLDVPLVVDVAAPDDGELPDPEPDDVLVLGAELGADPPDDVLGVVPEDDVPEPVAPLVEGLLVPLPDVEPVVEELVPVPLDGELPVLLDGDEPLVEGLLVVVLPVEVVPLDDVVGLEDVVFDGCEPPDEEPVDVPLEGADVLDEGLVVEDVVPPEPDEGLVEDVVLEGAASALRSTVCATAAEGTMSRGTITSTVTATSESHRRAMPDRAMPNVGRDLSRPPSAAENRTRRLENPTLLWR